METKACACGRLVHVKSTAECGTCYNRRWASEHRLELRERTTRYRKSRLEYFSKKQREYNRRLRAEAIATYGGRCDCCGETELAFLCIDHVGGGGRKIHSKYGLGYSFYLWLKKRAYPRDGLRVLCANCNQAVRGGQGCPHKN